MSMLRPLRAAAREPQSASAIATRGRPGHASRAVRSLWLLWLCVAPVAIAAPSAAQEVSWDIKILGEAATNKFKAEFLAKKQNVETYLASKRFALFSGNLDVSVFNGDPFSEALLFAWDGRRGHMYFPAARIKEERAAIIHELTHVHAPNEIRFLGEGYPAYVEEQIGNLKAYPTLGVRTECAIENYNDAFNKAPLRAVQLDKFDGAPTQREAFLGDNMGLEKAFPKTDDGKSQRRAFSYLVSSSFVKYLIDNYSLEKFKALYDTTPLTPGKATKADPGRWQEKFSGKNLDDL